MKTLYKIESVLKTKEGTTFEVDHILVSKTSVHYGDSNGNKYEQDEIAMQFREVKSRAKKTAKAAPKTSNKPKKAKTNSTQDTASA